MALSSASTGAMNAASVDGCLRLLYSHPQAVPVVAKPAVQGVNPAASSYTNLAATRSKSQDIIYSEGSSLSQLQIRPWPCNSGTRRPWRKPLAPVSAVAPNGACADRWADDPMAPAPLRVGIIGFGNFGQFIAKGILRQGHEVVATSRTDYSSYCTSHGIQFHRTMDAMFTDDQPLDVLLICSSILSTESLIRRIPFQLLSPDTVVTDVLSVKQFPKNLFLEVLPPETGILCTHPMFGPESGKHGWGKLPFVYDKVRVAGSGTRQEQNCERFLQIFEHEGCRMVEMSCEEHDRHAAGSQFITHTIGRILSHLDLESTPINTKGYETLLQLTENTVSDSFDLYYGLFMYNVNATEQMDNLDRAFETVKQKLFGRLHDILRKQLVERVPMTSNAPNGNSTTAIATSTSGSRPGAGSRSKATTTSHPSPFFLPSHDDMTGLSSFAIPSAAPAPAATSNAGRNNK